MTGSAEEGASRAAAGHETRAAIQGEEGAFSHVAVRQLLGEVAQIVPCRTFDDLFRAVEDDRADRVVVPVENTLAGSIPANLDRLLASPLHIHDETTVRVELCLIVAPGTTEAQIERAASHPVALEQCRTFFEHHPRMTPIAVYDTAGSIRDLLRGDASYEAAIGSRLAASLYGGEMLHAGIEDNPENFTRFLELGREVAPITSGVCRAVVAFVVPHEPGSLHRALGFFASADVDLTRLESRPIPGRPWQYRFYADLLGERSRVEAAIAELGGHAFEHRVLGVYGTGAGEGPMPVTGGAQG